MCVVWGGGIREAKRIFRAERKKSGRRLCCADTSHRRLHDKSATVLPHSSLFNSYLLLILQELNVDAMAQQMTMFKGVNATFTSARPNARAQRRAMTVRAGPYDAELMETAVSYGNCS